MTQVRNQPQIGGVALIHHGQQAGSGGRGRVNLSVDPLSQRSWIAERRTKYGHRTLGRCRLLRHDSLPQIVKTGWILRLAGDDIPVNAVPVDTDRAELKQAVLLLSDVHATLGYRTHVRMGSTASSQRVSHRSSTNRRADHRFRTGLSTTAGSPSNSAMRTTVLAARSWRESKLEDGLHVIEPLRTAAFTRDRCRSCRLAERCADRPIRVRPRAQNGRLRQQARPRGRDPHRDLCRLSPFASAGRAGGPRAS